ncbi:MAG: amidohydrolase family protein, partial [Clostridia bacterium]|nr:amidohydrolase family protein [Clostridia bacterium]
MNADLYIKNANIIDGSGQPSFKGSIAVKDGRIAEVFLAGTEPEEISAAKTIDAEGYTLTPGFIDIHCHTDETVFSYPECQSKILQGVTTDMAGNCGISCAPVNPENLELLRGYVGEMPYNWRSFGEFLEKVEDVKPAVNLACGVGHGSLRIAAMGFDPTPANKLQMDTMKHLLSESIDEGAWQLSSGLIYPPGVYADSSELAELCKVAAAKGGYYSTHMRNEGLDIINALNEALDTAEKSGVSLEISHHKLARREVWGRSAETLAMIEAARAKGMDVWADQYPYDASSTYLSSNIPSWAFEGGVEALKKRAEDPVLRKKMLADMDESHRGRWQDISLGYAKTENYAPYMGRNMAEIGEIFGLTASEACLKIV